MTQYEMKLERAVEAALAVAKFSSEGSRLEAVLITGLAGALAELFGVEEDHAFKMAETIAQDARALLSALLRGAR